MLKPFNLALLLFANLLLLGCTGGNYSDFQLAAARGQADRVEIMLSKGADVDERNKYGKTALMLAASAGHTDTILALLARNAHIDAQDIDGMTALIEAAANGHTTSVTALLEKGADINIANRYDATALTNSVFFGHLEATKALLKSKKSLNIETTEKALLVASGLGNTEIIKELLDYGVNVNARGKLGRTPLMAAIEFGHRGAVKMLVENGANTNMTDLEDNSVIQIATRANDAEIIELVTKNRSK